MTVATMEQRVAAEQSWRDRVQSARCLLSAFDLLGVPGTLLDVGCGRGHLVRIADALGVLAVGFDIAGDEEIMPSGSELRRFDLTKHPIEAPSHLVLCLEVAEHLPPSAAATLCDTLASSTKGTLLFSAATPGQGGSGHLHEAPHAFWEQKLRSRGLHRSLTKTIALREKWKVDAPRAPWYANNLMVFERSGA